MCSYVIQTCVWLHTRRVHIYLFWWYNIIKGKHIANRTKTLLLLVLREGKRPVMTTPKRPGAHFWQICWQIYPPSTDHRCLEYCYTKLGRSTPQSIKHRCLEYHYTKLGRSAGRSTPHSAMHHGIYIMGCIWQPFWILQEKVGISFYFWIIRVVISQLAL